MNSTWVQVFIASLFEVLWVVGLKYAYDFWTWLGTVICIGLSFILLISAARHLPVGTVYAVFVGLGTAGTALVDVVVFEESLSLMKLLLLAILLAGVIGLKLVSGEKKEEGGNA